MKAHDFRSIRRAKFRRGNIMALSALLLPVLFLLSAFAINIAYMQLTRTELMVATDAAARAGGRAFSELQDLDWAKGAATATAALNHVAGRPLRLRLADSDNEIEFGLAAPAQNGFGRFAFTKIPTQAVRAGSQVANSIRVTGRRKADSTTGSVPLPFPNFGLPAVWNVEQQAVATQVDRDIALVLDRSGSMSWKTYDWPRGVSPWGNTVYAAAVDAGLMYRHRGNYYLASGVDTYAYQDWAWQEYFGLGTPPTSSWEDLRAAANSFLQVLDETDQQEFVSVASYASTASLDQQLTADYGQVINAIDRLSPSGATAIGLGMQSAITSLYNEGFARPFAAKTIIVMTDGIHNTGIDPVRVARELVATHNVTIHTVTFSAAADQARMRAVADIAGGTHYHADSGAELTSVFEALARNLPTLVTQ
jgi:hypothetical protein